MAQKVVTTLVSDLSGKELGEDGQTIKYGFLGVDYEIDLSQKEADEFAGLIERYVNASRRVGGRKQTGMAVRSVGSSTGMDPEQAKKIRSWAKDNGMKVSSRGRISQEVVEAFEKAHSAA